MFEEILKNKAGGFTPESFPIEEEFWKTKHEASHMHKIVIIAEAELSQVEGFDWKSFSRDNLRDVWSSRCSFCTKYLATLWWGHVFRRIFNEVYSPSNLNKMKRISARLNSALLDAAQTKNHKEFCEKISGIIESMQGGAFRIPYVGPAFFTKVIQFFFAAHPIQSEKEYLPIIADRWLMRALYCEMTDCDNIDVRDDVFAQDRRNVFLRKDGKGSIAESYVKYVEYFNQRCKTIGAHPWDMEGLLFKNHIVKQRFQSIINNTVPENQGDKTVTLRVYDSGKTFLILNNRITLPHDTDEVYVEYKERWYEARLGSYSGRGNTLRGKDTIQKLIEDNNWLPGQELQAVFHYTDEGHHVFEIIQ